MAGEKINKTRKSIFASLFRTCPKTGRVVGLKWDKWWHKLLFPLMGLAAVIWYCIRVFPKPNRAAYPCMQVAGPMALGFLGYIGSLFLMIFGIGKSKTYLKKSRYVLALVFIIVAACGMALFNLTSTGSVSAVANGRFTPIDQPNQPMGTAQGISPGRVAWAHDPAATSWNGSSSYWWSSQFNNQSAVNAMLANVVNSVAGSAAIAQSWDKLFRDFNIKANRGNVGYNSSEKIAIKINLNSGGNNNNLDASPQMVFALLDQLVNRVGVPQANITIYDAARGTISAVANYCRPTFTNVKYNDWGGWVYGAISYSAEIWDSGATNLPRAAVDARYLINMSLLKRHSRYSANWVDYDGQTAVTLAGKNHFGSLGNPGALHVTIRDWARGMNTYNPIVDLMGSKNLGGKTVLYIMDGLYAGDLHESWPKRWVMAPFNNDWPSSVFASQDPVAIDSVGLDFLNAEWGLVANADNYLHEAARADNPPSGTYYRPDGTRLASLGVHEHWNNKTSKQYSRNLGTGSGIELVYIPPNGNTPTPTAIPTPTPPLGANLALGKTTVVSSAENANYGGAFAVDGSAVTRWSSAFSDPQWIYVDLGASYKVSRVILNWEAAFATGYRIEVSADAENWTQVFSIANGDGGIDDLAVSGTGRYVRMYGTSRATAYGYSLWELTVNGTSDVTPTPTVTPTATPTPTGTNFTIPGLIQAEDFTAFYDTTAGNQGTEYRNTDVDIEVCSEGGYDVGWTAAGEWLQYPVFVTAQGQYDIEFRVAKQTAGTSAIHVKYDGVNVTGSISIPSTGGWQAWTTVRKTGVSLDAGNHTLTLYIETEGFNINWLNVTGTVASPTPTNTPTPTPTSTPTATPTVTPTPTGTNFTIPGLIQAEDFTAYYDTTAGNQGTEYRNTDVDIEVCSEGGYNVGWTAAGEWLQYPVSVAVQGQYDIEFRVAKQTAGTSAIHVKYDGVNITGSISIPSTGGWQTWTTVRKTGVSLSAGNHTLTLYVETEGFNINWLNVTGTVVLPTPAPDPRTPVSINGQLQVIGLKLCNQYGKPIQLRGMSTHGLQWYSNCITEASLDALAYDWDADILRISLYVQEGGYETDPAGYTSRVKKIIDMVTARGMYALVDWHQLSPGDPNYNTNRAITFFTEIANTYKNQNNIIYDLCNEPNGCSWDAIKNYANQLIPVIRNIDNDAVILIGTHGWASLGVSDGRSAQDIVNNPLNFTNIMYTFHFYAASHGSRYLNELDWASDRLPIFVTEFGSQTASGDGANNFAMTQQYLDLMAAKKISWTNWNYSDDFRSGAVFKTGTAPNGPWTGTAPLKEAGIWIRERILYPADDFPVN